MITIYKNFSAIEVEDRDLQKRRRILFLILLLLFLLLMLSGCKSTHSVAVAERVLHDTCYVERVHYDSIHIDSWHSTYRDADTVYRDQIRYEYRYRMLHDTVSIHRVDSIPVIQEVEVVREVSRPLSWFDRLCRSSFFMFLFVIGIGIWLLIYRK